MLGGVIAPHCPRQKTQNTGAISDKHIGCIESKQRSTVYTWTRHGGSENHPEGKRKGQQTSVSKRDINRPLGGFLLFHCGVLLIYLRFIKAHIVSIAVRG